MRADPAAFAAGPARAPGPRPVPHDTTPARDTDRAMAGPYRVSSVRRSRAGVANHGEHNTRQLEPIENISHKGEGLDVEELQDRKHPVATLPAAGTPAFGCCS